jgi:hypothetical protein
MASRKCVSQPAPARRTDNGAVGGPEQKKPTVSAPEPCGITEALKPAVDPSEGPTMPPLLPQCQDQANQPPTKGLTRGGDLRQAQVDVPSSV